MLSTCDWGAKKIVTCDICRSFLIYATFDMGEKVTRHATLSLLKNDMRHWGPPIKGPTRVIVVHRAPCNRSLSPGTGGHEGGGGRGQRGGGTQPLEVSM